MAGGASEQGRSVASRVTAILTAFGSGGTHSLTELSALAGLPISTTHRLVGELVDRRLIERTDSGKYRVGLPLRMIGGGGAVEPVPLLGTALDVISDVAHATRSSVRIGILEGTRILVAHASLGRTPDSGLVPDPVPAPASALGRALLAFNPPEVVDAVLATSGADAGSVDADRLQRILAGIRLARVAVSRGQDGAGSAVAVPVFGTGGVLLAALEAQVPDLRSGFEAVRGALLVAAGSLSRQLATTAPPEPSSDGEPETAAG